MCVLNALHTHMAALRAFPFFSLPYGYFPGLFWFYVIPLAVMSAALRPAALA